METKIRLFTSESVSEGHPDKVADAISDAILDKLLSLDPNARVAFETLVTTNTVVVAGELSVAMDADISIEEVVRNTIREIGYDREELLFSADSVEIINKLHSQSPDIAMGVTSSLEDRQVGGDELSTTGAGDQGIMFGGATNETPELMPLPVSIAHKLIRKYSELRRNGELEWARPDAKSQVTVAYDENDKPVYIDTVLMSVQHRTGISQDEIRNDLINKVIDPVLRNYGFDTATHILTNPTGQFIIGGPHGDTGLTGRKIIVDTYGGYFRHGGGAFSGKDATKVDRSAAYASRWVAKNLVAAGVADKVEVQVSYAIGVARPVSVRVDTFGTGKYNEADIVDVVNRVFDLRPAAIIRDLELTKPIFSKTTNYGHFGKDELPWEQLNKVEEIKSLLGGIM